MNRVHRNVRPLLLAVGTAVAVLVAGAGEAPAQHIGLKGGLNLSDFVGGGAEEDDFSVGLNAGGSMQIISIGPVSIGPEIYYVEKGSKPRQVDVGGGGTATVPTGFSLPYVEIPVLASVRLPRFGGDRFEPYLFGGPAFAWNLDCDLSFEEGAAPPEETCASLLGGDLESTLEDYEQGVTFGGGLNVVVIPGHGALTLDLRTTQGLSEVIERESGEDLELRNRSFLAMLGYSFSI